jgi:hypothetical protein
MASATSLPSSSQLSNWVTSSTAYLQDSGRVSSSTFSDINLSESVISVPSVEQVFSVTCPLLSPVVLMSTSLLPGGNVCTLPCCLKMDPTRTPPLVRQCGCHPVGILLNSVALLMLIIHSHVPLASSFHMPKGCNKLFGSKCPPKHLSKAACHKSQ